MRPDREAEVVSAFRDTDGPVRVHGGGVSALPAREGAETLSLAALRGIVEYRPSDLVCRARAGTTLAEVSTALAGMGQRLPLAPWGDPGRGTIGGMFAAAVDGLRARGGFRARDILLAARAVLASGDVVAVGAGVVKSVAGFDVPKLLCGSRGTLAAITDVTFRVESAPETAASCTAHCTSRTRAMQRVRALRTVPLAPAALVVIEDAVHVLFEGPREAVASAVKGARLAGLRRTDVDWASLAAVAESPDGEGLLLDVLRGRRVPGRHTVLHPLFERVRAACDPACRLQAGRGYGARR